VLPNATAAVAAGRLLQQTAAAAAEDQSKERKGGGWLWGLRIVGGEAEVSNPNPNIPELFQFLGMFIGNFIWTFRLSLGDYDLIGEVPGMSFADNVMFWIVWVLSVTLTSIIFLNFIIAEASASYTKVVDDMEAIIAKERAAMTHESEEMTMEKNKTEV
jgi:hypothetical protein